MWMAAAATMAAATKPVIIARFGLQLKGGPQSCSRKRWASNAAMHPVPALVIAWR
jgi:hypothetical protein